MVEDELLKWKFRRGSREALARIYEKYLDSMLTLAMGLLNDVGEAEDVVHDVFVSFARSAPGFRLRGSLGGYLATSVVNRVRDRKRQQRRRACRDAGLCVSNEAAGPEQTVIFTEQDFGYDPNGTPEAKEAAITAWEQWLATDGTIRFTPDADLLPVPDSAPTIR